MQPQRKSPERPSPHLRLLQGVSYTAPVVMRIEPGKLIATVFLTCVGIEIGLVVADATINYADMIDSSPIQRFFNSTREDGLASWFAVTQTWMEALTLGLLTWIASRTNAGTGKVLGWGILTLFFGYMAMDDGAKFHERMGSAFQEAVADGAFLSEATFAMFPSYTWQLLFLPFFGSLGLFMAVFLWREIEALGPRLMVLAAVGLMALAVGMDFFEGMDPEHPMNIHTMIRQSPDITAYDVSHFSKSFEEFFEMLANTLLWCVFLGRLPHMAPDLRFLFESGDDETAGDKG